MSILIETTFGDLVIDLDITGSPHLCRNILKLAKARYYTNTLVYNVQPGRFCQLGDPRGDGSGGCSIYGLIDAVRSKLKDVTLSKRRFMKSDGRSLNSAELCQKGRLLASEMGGIRDTIGSQLILTIDGCSPGSGDGRALDGLTTGIGSAAAAVSDTNGQQGRYLSVGYVVEDEDDVLGKINGLYCDANGRPYADVRIIRCHVLDDPFDDPEGLEDVLASRGVKLEPEQFGGDDDNNDGDAPPPPRLASASPNWERPPVEVVERRIAADVALAEEDDTNAEEREEALRKQEDKSRAVVLEMLGDLPSAEIKAPENVLFVCKLNPVTDDEDLELIFSRFDPNARAEIIRDPDTGDSLCYAFVEFTSKEQCNEAYFKMNNALVDDRRIKVDFSQSVAKVWNKYTQRKRGGHNGGHQHGGGGMGRGSGRGGGQGGNMGRGGGGKGYGAAPPPQRSRWAPPPPQNNAHASYDASSSHRNEDNHHGRARSDRSHDHGVPADRKRHDGGDSSGRRRDDDRRRSHSRSHEWDRTSRHERKRRSHSRSRSRDRKRRHHKKDHKRRDRDRDNGHDSRRHERRHESKKKKRRHRSRSRSRSKDRKRSSRRHHSRSRS